MNNGFAFDDQADSALLPVLGEIPKRWGRMNPLSRLLLFEVGKILQKEGVIRTGQKCNNLGLCAGLIGGTKRGCLHTDYAFVDSMDEGLPSPAVFGYTLPNIPLAEAAGQYGLTGPVYAVFDEDKPQKKAEIEAEKLLKYQPEISFMLACQFEHVETQEGVLLLVNLTKVDR